MTQNAFYRYNIEDQDFLCVRGDIYSSKGLAIHDNVQRIVSFSRRSQHVNFCEQETKVEKQMFA